MTYRCSDRHHSTVDLPIRQALEALLHLMGNLVFVLIIIHELVHALLEEEPLPRRLESNFLARRGLFGFSASRGGRGKDL